MPAIPRCRLFAIAALVVLVVAAWSCPAFAQSRTTGALAGEVDDETGEAKLPGATVEIASPVLLGRTRSARSDAQGRFRFSELPPGLYHVTASSPGYKTVQVDAAQVSTGLTAEVPIEMLAEGGGETIDVHGAPAAIDPSTSSVSTILTPGYLENIPHDRDPSHLLDLAPGINLESAYGSGEESGIAYQIDGVDISDPQGGAPWSLFNPSLIDEVQLVGLGAPAEYGQFTGVVFNSVTKSGGDESSGSAEFFYGGGSLTGSSDLGDLNPSIDRDQEETLQLGGPIRKERAWYFVSGQYAHLVASEGGPNETETDPRAFVKATSLVGGNSTLQGWMQWDHTRIIGRNGDAFTPLEATTGEDNPELVGNLSFNSQMGSSSVLTVGWSGYSGYHHFNPQNGFSLPGHVDAETGIASVNASQFGIVDRRRNQLNSSFSRHLTNLIAGYHDVKVGTEIERSRSRDRYGYPGGAFYSDNEGPVVDPSTRKRDRYSLVSLGGGYDAEGRNERVSVYAQDSWRLAPRFTLNPGVRWDSNRGKVPGATVFKTDVIAPRLGLAWDLGSEGRSVLRAHYGRYYEALYAAFYYYMAPGAFAPLTTRRIFNRSGFTQTLTTTPGQRYAIDPNIRQPYLDQYLLGLDQQLSRGVVLSATLVYRRNADFIETVSRDGIFVPVQGEVPGTGQTITLFDYLNPDTDVLLYTNPAGLHRTYRAAILSAMRPLRDNWQLAASYVYSEARGNIDNLGSDELGIGGNTPFFDGHFLDTPNSLVNAEGRLTHDQTHQVKLQGTRVFPALHLSLSAGYTFHSGDTWTPRSTCLLTPGRRGALDCHDFPQGPVLYFVEPRGSRRLPARNELDLRMEWQYGSLWGSELHVSVDVFNVTNQSRATEVETLAEEELGEPATANFPRSIRLGFSVDW
jgi:hypothetical protein